MTIPTDEIKPCPFCGGTDPFSERADYSSSYIVCNDCLARGPVECQDGDDEEEPGQASAIAAWNTRTPTPADDATVERDGWQPIETAPLEEGKQMLVHNDRGTFVGTWDSEWDIHERGWWMIDDGKDFERPLRGSLPTHWMPLPTPPEDTQP